MKHLFGRSLALLLAVLCTVMLLVPALAAEAADEVTDSTEVTSTLTPSVKIPVTVTATGSSIVRNETYEVTITADEAGNPMPEQTPLSLRDGETGYFEMTYTDVGDYHYTITLTEGNSSNATYDETEYTLWVQVVFEQDEDGNYVMVGDEQAMIIKSAKLHVSNVNEKYDEAAFEVEYEATESPIPIETPNVYNDTTPEPSVTPVTEISEEPVPEAATEAPSEEPSVEISEEPVPQGDLTIEDEPVPQGGVTIEDEAVPQGALPQTGQLWWPVFLMAILGMALLAAAGFDILMTRRNAQRS